MTTVRCSICDIVKDMVDDYIIWRHAQDAFPYLSVDKRISLIIPFCDTCWESFVRRESWRHRCWWSESFEAK